MNTLIIDASKDELKKVKTREYNKKYNQLNKEKIKEYNNSPSVKLRKQLWYQSHKSDPIFKAKKKESTKKSHSKPEFKEKYKKYMDVYNKEYKKKYYETLKIKHKEYYSNPKTKERVKLYLKENKEMVKKWNDNFYKKHKIRIILRQKDYNNKPEIKEKHRQYHNVYEQNRISTDINFRLRKYLASRLRVVLKGQAKKSSILSLIGCPIDNLKLHIQSQFKEGMSWENHGEWHIDHIKPCALFDLLNEEEQKKCFHYTNLQPLWAKDNLSKGARI